MNDEVNNNRIVKKFESADFTDTRFAKSGEIPNRMKESSTFIEGDENFKKFLK